MVLAWFYNDQDQDDPRLLHQHDPIQHVSLESLQQLGILYWFIDLSSQRLSSVHHDRNSDDQQHLDLSFWNIPNVELICKERNYKNRDIIEVSERRMKQDYKTKLQTFFTEHLHEDEEIRLILDGSGFFDIRDHQDQWIRIHLHPGDLIILPAGLYHRFTPDQDNYTLAMRLFQDDPKWTPINRNESR